MAMKIGVDFVGIGTPFYCHDGHGNLLMHKRTENCRDEHHRWDSGSGKLEHGLSLEENVLKEVEEEYGCKGEIEGRLPAHDIFREQNGQKTHWLVIPFIIRVDPKEARNNEPHKIAEIGWFPWNNLPEPLHSGFAYSFRRYREDIDKLIGCGTRFV
jgi:8-oxo-dGTP pyrophosphatase MutT (NUDIX family)